MYNYYYNKTSIDLSKETIAKLFNERVMELTKKMNKEKALLKSFDLQFSDIWI